MTEMIIVVTIRSDVDSLCQLCWGWLGGRGETESSTSMEGALVQVLNIFAGYWSVDLRDDVPVTHPHLVEISVFSLLSFLFGFVEILFAVFDLRQALLVVSPATCAAALNYQPEQENKRPYC